ncbi:MAG TPA: hypothetical protein VGK67_34545 [Myxococcales bacterium]|jgi:hypothetical protein
MATDCARWRWANVAVLAAAACSAAGCRTEGACDIYEAECQRDIFYSVLDARGLAWDAWASPPPMEVITQEQFRALLEENAKGQPAPGLSWDPALRLLGLLDRDASSQQESIDSQVESVVAFYSSLTQRVTIIERNPRPSVDSSSRTLAHEIVHALQDRDVGLRRYVSAATSGDHALALKSMIEGEAVLFELLTDLRWRQLSPMQVDWTGFFGDFSASLDEAVSASESRWAATQLLLPYYLGSQYLHSAYARGGVAEVEHAFLSQPGSMAEVADVYGHPRVRAALSCQGPAAPPGYLEVGSTRLGAAGLYAFAVRQVTPDLSMDLMASWSDDRLRFYKSPEGASAVSWTVRMAGARAPSVNAQALRAAAAAAGARVESRGSGEELVIVGAEDPAVLSAWDLMACGE